MKARIEMWLEGGETASIEGELDREIHEEGQIVSYFTKDGKGRLNVVMSKVLAVRFTSLDEEPIPEEFNRAIGFHNI